MFQLKPKQNTYKRIYEYPHGLGPAKISQSTLTDDGNCQKYYVFVRTVRKDCRDT